MIWTTRHSMLIGAAATRGAFGVNARHPRDRSRNDAPDHELVHRLGTDRLGIQLHGRALSCQAFSSISMNANSKALALRTSCSTPAGRKYGWPATSSFSVSPAGPLAASRPVVSGTTT